MRGTGPRFMMILSVACATLVVACAPAPEPSPEDEAEGPLRIGPEAVRNAQVQVEEVAVTDLRDEVETVGVVAAEPGRTLHLRPLSAGVITSVSTRPGDRVPAGRDLLRYDVVELGDLVGSYASRARELVALEARRELTERNLARGRELFDLEAISRRELETREADDRAAAAAVQGARAELGRLAARMRRLGVTDEELEALRRGEDTGTVGRASERSLQAPFAAVVTEMDAARGEMIVPERPVATLVNTEVVWVLADVYEVDLGRVQPGWTCQARLVAHPDHALEGRVESLAEAVDPATRTSKARCVVDNPDGLLRLEMFATVTLRAPEARPLLAVSIDALQPIDDEDHVFVVVGDDTDGGLEVEARRVVTGTRRGDRVEVVEGLAAGERVVISGSYLIASQLLRERIGGGH